MSKVTIFAGNGFPIKAVKPNRNAPCRCGSGKKQKNCCGTSTEYFKSKLNAKERNDQITALDKEDRKKRVILN